MSYIANVFVNLAKQTAFANIGWRNYVMIIVALVFLYLAIAKDFEPLLLVPIAFGMLLVNIYPDIIMSIEDSPNGTGGLLYYFYLLDEWAILPSLIFMGVGAMTDFGPLIANPISFLMGAAAQFGGSCSSVRYFRCILPCDCHGLQRQGSCGNLDHRRCGRPYVHFPCVKTTADGSAGSDRRRGIFLYVPRSDYPASDHAGIYNG